MNGSIDVIIGDTPEMIHNCGWLLAFGVVLIVLGVVAVVWAATATIASMVFFGWLLVFASVKDNRTQGEEQYGERNRHRRMNSGSIIRVGTDI